MPPGHEAIVRAAVEGLIDALLTAIRAEVGSAASAPVRLLSIGEGAAALGIGRTTLYAELASGHVHSIKVGRRRLIPTSAIANYIDARTLGPTRDSRR